MLAFQRPLYCSSTWPRYAPGYALLLLKCCRIGGCCALFTRGTFITLSLHAHIHDAANQADIDVRVEMFDMELADELFSGVLGIDRTTRIIFCRTRICRGAHTPLYTLNADF